MLVVVITVWAMVLGISPGLALITIPLMVLAFDRLHPSRLEQMR